MFREGVKGKGRRGDIAAVPRYGVLIPRSQLGLEKGDPPGGDVTGRAEEIGASVGGEARRWRLNIVTASWSLPPAERFDAGTRFMLF
jgi:hypothetical protein